MEARIDKWLWAARIYKTRSLAAEACKNSRIQINGATAKPSRTVKDGDEVSVRKPPVTYTFRVLQAIEKRVGAKLLPQILENITPSEQYEMLEMSRISGFVGSPESSKKKGARQFFFTNGRYMRHPYFAKAVAAAYEWLIPEGDAVPFFIKFEMEPERIDVNIHPTKTEIKFQDEQMVWQILLAAVREALNRFSAIPTIDFDTENKPDIPLVPTTQ